MTRLMFHSLLLVAILINAACRERGETPSASPASATVQVQSEPFRIGLVMPCLRDDKAFCQTMFDSLTKLQAEMSAGDLEFDVTGNAFMPDQVTDALRKYARSGYDLVIAHSSDYHHNLRSVAPDFPNTSFAWGADSRQLGLGNVFNYDAAAEQGGYVNGVLAANLSKRRVVGVVGSYEIGDVKLYIDGFVAGVEASAETVKTLVQYIDSWSDIDHAAKIAQMHIDAGADILTSVSPISLGPISVAQKNKALWFANQTDQASLAPDIVVASQVYDWTVVLKPMIRLVKKGELGGHTYLTTLLNGGLTMKYNDDFHWTPDLLQLALDTEYAIYTGAAPLTKP